MSLTPQKKTTEDIQKNIKKIQGIIEGGGKEFDRIRSGQEGCGQRCRGLGTITNLVVKALLAMTAGLQLVLQLLDLGAHL